MGPKLMNCCRPEQMGTKEFGKMLKKKSNSRRRKSPSQGSKEQDNWRDQEKNYEREVSEAGKQV